MAKTSRMKRNARKTSYGPRRELPTPVRTRPVLSAEEMMEASRLTTREKRLLNKLQQEGSASLTPKERAILEAKGVYYPAVPAPGEMGMRTAGYTPLVSKEEGEAASKEEMRARAAEAERIAAARAGAYVLPPERAAEAISRAQSATEAAKIAKKAEEEAFARAAEITVAARAMPRPTEPGPSASRAEWRAYNEELEAWRNIQRGIAPLTTKQTGTWADRYAVAGFLNQPTTQLYNEDPEVEAMREELEGSELQAAAFQTYAKMQQIREDDTLDPKEKKAALLAIPEEEREAFRAYNEALAEIRRQQLVDPAERLARQKEAREKIRASRLDSVPKRLQKEVKKRALAIASYENSWRDQIANARAMLRASLESGTMSAEQAKITRTAIRKKELELEKDTTAREMELERWWRLESGETEEPVYFPEISDALFPGAAPTKEVKFGTREAAIARAAGEVAELPEPVQLQVDAVTEAVDDFLNVRGVPRSDEELAKIGRGIREAATLDLDKERQDLSKLVAKGKLTSEERDEIWLKIRNVNAIAKDNYQNALRLAYTARKLRGDSNPDHPTDRELGAAAESRDKRARLAMAGRFTKELRGLYEYVTIEDPRTGELIYTRMPKIDADGNPIWEGILTRYAGQPGYSGSFNVKYMRARRSETGAWERMGMAEAQMERYSRERATAKRLFAQLVVDYNRYTKKEREQTLKVGDTLQMFTAPRDEATIKFFIREYGFQLPEWSKLRGAPRAMRSMSAADWTKEYGLRAPKVQSEDSRILQRRKEQREAKHRAIVARYKAASQS